MSECEHALPFRDRFFAAIGKVRRCTKCGAHVYVDTPWIEGLVPVTWIFFPFLIAFAWIDGGIGWFWLTAFIAVHVAIFLVETGYRKPIEIDIDHYRRKSKTIFWNALVALIIVVGLGALLWSR